MTKRINKTVASFDYQNGGFGVNTVSLIRTITNDRWLPNGWLVTVPGNDAFFYYSVIDAKAHYRRSVVRFLEKKAA